MSNTATHAMNTAVYMDGYDLRRLLTTARAPMTKTDVNTSVFGTEDMECIAGMRNGAFNIEGFRKATHAGYIAIVEEAIGGTNTEHALSYAPDGPGLGNQAILMNSHENSFEVGAPYNQAIMISAVFNATGGPRLGRILHDTIGTDTLTVNTVQRITFTNASASQFMVITDGTTQVAINAGMTNTQFATAMQNLVGGTVTGSGTRTTSTDANTGETLYSSYVQLSIGGALAGVNVPLVSVTSGEVQNFSTTTGDADADYAIGAGTAAALGFNEAVFQSNTRLGGGVLTNVVTKGSSTAGVSDPPVNVLTGATISGLGDTSNVGLANDGNYSTCWNPGTSQLGTGYWEADRGVGAPDVTMASYVIRTWNDIENRPTQWILETSSDNATWTTLDSKTVQSLNWPQTDNTFVVGGTLKRYIRFSGFLGFSGVNGIAITEFVVNSAGASSPSIAHFNVYFPVVNDNVSQQTPHGTNAAVTTLQQGAAAPSVATPSSVQVGLTETNISYVTASGSESSVDEGAATTNGYTAHLHVTTVAGISPTLQVILEHSTDNATWTGLYTFTTKSAQGYQRVVSGLGVTVNRYVRARYVVTGTTPRIAFALTLSRFTAMKHT